MTSVKNLFFKLVGLNPLNYKDEIREFIRRNRWMLFGFIFLFSFSALFIVNNVRNVNTLLKDIRSYEKELSEYKNNRKILNEQIKRLESPERINRIAIDNLGMVRPNEAPKTLY